jgi:hypothetical protein
MAVNLCKTGKHDGLAAILSSSEHNSVRNVLSAKAQSSLVWIGLEGLPLKWDNGEPYVYSAISGSDDGQKWWRLVKSENWGWNDTGDSGELNGFLCERRTP